MLLELLWAQLQYILQLWLELGEEDEVAALQEALAIYQVLVAELTMCPTRRRLLVDVPDVQWTNETWSADTFRYYTRYAARFASYIWREVTVFDRTRFTPDQFTNLHRLLDIPRYFILENRAKVDGAQALVLFLCRMAEPVRLGREVTRFGWELSRCSRVFGAVLDYLYIHFARALLCWSTELLTPAFLDACAAATVSAGCPVPNIVGFINGTNRAIARPTVDQESVSALALTRLCIC
jgi:hypothetical protein